MHTVGVHHVCHDIGRIVSYASFFTTNIESQRTPSVSTDISIRYLYANCCQIRCWWQILFSAGRRRPEDWLISAEMMTTMRKTWLWSSLVDWKSASRLICMPATDLDEYVICLCTLIYTVSQKKKQDTKLLPITSPNVNRFSKFFHWQTHW